MEAILPFKIKNEHKYFQCALKLGLDEMQMYKFIYVMQQSDLDMFPKMHDERINVLIYCWELCEDYKQKLNPDEWELPEEMETILKLLVPWSLDIWFSKEWDKCKLILKLGLIHCLNRARDLLMRVPDMMQINWDFLLLYNLTPWNVSYLRNLTVTKEKTLETGAQSIETQEEPATHDDVGYIKLEPLPLIVLRLIKLFDQCSIDMVKTLCMRVIAAWNGMYQVDLGRSRYIPAEDKRCLLLICHIYLMAVYESDDVKGYVIDNLINNIRFYCQGFQSSHALYAMENLEYTPARFIALTNMRLRLRKEEFFDFFIWNSYDTSLVNLFGVVSQAYKSYLLGNILMELNNMNDDDFASNVPLYKRLMNSYVNEREKSELFMLSEMDKLENQRFAHNIILTMKNMTDFKSKICKGNRMSNIGNYENSDDANIDTTATAIPDVKLKRERPSDEAKEDSDHSEKESDLRLDPIFQNIPKNENILYYVYEVLSKKNYKGWHFAKIVLLVKIISHELNMIETWRYHPGLTIDFMLNLENKLSKHYSDLAKIFSEHAFIEQEFWLTAFYLNPTVDGYETIKRLGMRNNRKRTDENTKLVMSIDNIDAKYGLLSSTIDVKEIAVLENTEELDGDYDPLFNALKSLHLPDSLIKDMLTIIFLPRNRSFAWVVDWTELRTRCKILLNSTKEKKRFVELNMAEANERLKFLNIDYEKYKNRPQLDYGTIEEGYENLMNREDYDVSDDDDEDDEDFEDDEDAYETQKGGRGARGGREAEIKKEEEKLEDDNSQEEEDPYLTGKRRTRSRVAATMATFLFQDIPRATRRKRNQNNELESKDVEIKISDDNKTKEDKIDLTKDSDDSKSPITISDSPVPSPSATTTSDTKDTAEDDIIKKNIKVCLKERPSFSNSTPEFQPLIDIWNVEKSDLKSIDNNCVSLLESSAVLQRMLKLKLLNKEINPLGCNEHEAIDEREMLIINTDFPMPIRFSTPEPETKHAKVATSSTNSDSIKEDDKIVTATTTEDSSNDKDATDIAETTETDHPAVVEEVEIATSKPEEPFMESIDVAEDIEIVTTPVPEEFSTDKDAADVTPFVLGESDSDVIKEVMKIITSSKREEDFIDSVDVAEEVEIATPSMPEESSKDKDSDDITEVVKNVPKDVIEDDDISVSSILVESSKNKDSNNSAEVDKSIVMEVELIDESSVLMESTTDTKDISEDKSNKMEVESSLAPSISTESDKDNSEPATKSDDVCKSPQPSSTDISDKSINSDMSTTALKDTEEVSESNCEINSKFSSELEVKDENHQNEENINEISKANEIKETEKENNKASIKEDDQTGEMEIAALEGDNKEQIKETKEDEEENKAAEDNEEQKNDKMDETEIPISEETESKKKEESNDIENNKMKLEKTVSENQIDINNCTEIVKDSDDKKIESTTTDMEKHREESSDANQKSTDKDCKILEINDKLENSDNKDNTNVTTDSQNTEITKETTNEDSKNVEKSSQDDTLNDTNKTCVIKDENSEIDKNDEKTKIIESDPKAGTDQKADVDVKTEMDENKSDVKMANVLSPSGFVDDTMDSLKFDAESEEDDEMRAKQLRLTKRCKVLIPKLRVVDVANLRQPKVRVKRINIEAAIEESKIRRKHLTKKAYLHIDDSSNNSSITNSSSSDAYRPLKSKPKPKSKIKPKPKSKTKPKPKSKQPPKRRHSLRQTHTSESENDSNNSEDVKISDISSARFIRERRLSTPVSSTHLSNSTLRSSRLTSVSQSNLIVTPRSASGLKLRISNIDHPTDDKPPSSKRSKLSKSSIDVDDVIQLSSSSSDCVIAANALEPIDEVIDIDEHPLFEEEIPIRKRST